jgi:hypothetical protein
VPAYDTESPGKCREACRKIARVHRELGVPATFFIVGQLLEKEGDAYRELLDEPGLFEIASHTYSHRMLRDQPVCGPAASPEQIHRELFLGKQRVEECFGRACTGVRPGCGFDKGLRGAPEVAKEVAAAGFSYISSQLWGPFTTVPAPLEKAYTYAEEGCPDLWEFPGHGWHENVLKGHNAVPGRLLLWPPVYPEMMRLTGFLETPQEEFEVHRFFVDRATRDALEYVSLIWHPWSLNRFDPEMRMLRLMFDYIRSQDLAFARFADLRARRSLEAKTRSA